MNAAVSSLQVSGGDIHCSCGARLRLAEEQPGRGIGAGTMVTFHAFCPKCTGKLGSPVPVPEILYWRDPVSDPPDDEQLVLVHAPGRSEPVWLGYREDGAWFEVEGGRYRSGTVIGWAEMPAGAAPR